MLRTETTLSARNAYSYTETVAAWWFAVEDVRNASNLFHRYDQC